MIDRVIKRDTDVWRLQVRIAVLARIEFWNSLITKWRTTTTLWPVVRLIT
jgi:hypothetical protein